jgi:hypothetical protein
MKITKINSVILDVDGIKPLTNPEKKCNLTVKDVCINSILSTMPDAQGRPETDEKAKMEKWEIYKLFKDAKGEVELTTEQLNLVKKCVGYWQPPLILGQVYEFIENKKA